MAKPQKQTENSQGVRKAEPFEQPTTREINSAVRVYLNTLTATTSKGYHGRHNRAWVEQRLPQVEDLLADNSLTPMTRVELIQERMNLTKELAVYAAGDNISELEKAFIKFGPLFAERKGISYQAFREVGVPVTVLEEAGIAR